MKINDNRKGDRMTRYLPILILALVGCLPVDDDDSACACEDCDDATTYTAECGDACDATWAACGVSNVVEYADTAIPAECGSWLWAVVGDTWVPLSVTCAADCGAVDAGVADPCEAPDAAILDGVVWLRAEWCGLDVVVL